MHLEAIDVDLANDQGVIKRSITPDPYEYLVQSVKCKPIQGAEMDP